MDADNPNMRIFWPIALLISALCTAISVSLTGFHFGVNNNVFHIPYVLDLTNDPQFAGNAFYATLENFTSIVWPVIKLFASEGNIETVFFIAFILSRFAAFLGLSYLLHVNGLGKPIWLLLGMLLVSVTAFFQGVSPIGGNGQFIHYFSHSEVAWGPIFFALAFLQQRRILLSTLMVSLTFSINIFIGVWLAFIGLISALFFKQPITIANCTKAVLIFLTTSAPVLFWVVSSIGGDASADFSYIEYIRSYHMYHFLIEGAKASKIIALSAIVLAGLIAALYSAKRQFWLGLQVGWIALMAIGITLPYLIDNRFIFNLHLLRSDGLEQAIAIILMVFAAIQLLKDTGQKYCQMLGVIIIASLASIIPDPSRYLDFIIAVGALSIGLLYRLNDLPKLLRFVLKPFAGKADIFAAVLIATFIILNIVHIVTQELTTLISLRFVIIMSALFVCFKTELQNTHLLTMLCALIVAISAGTIYANKRAGIELSDRFPEPKHVQEEQRAMKDDWKSLLAQIREGDLKGTFLIPVRDRESGFQLFARRPIWVDWRQGAAVMWSPSFYEQWDTRYQEALALETDKDITKYAQKNNINNIVLKGVSVQCHAPYREKLRTLNYAVCARDQ